jgi:hypothetical protein
MDDPEYAAKYSEGAEKSDVVGKVKQAADARFQEDACGCYASGGMVQRGDSDQGLLAVELGIEGYHTSYLTSRLALAGMANSDDWFTGADAGLRLQTPTRLAPFAGVGVFVGGAKESIVADDDWQDNDDDGDVDEWGEEETRMNGAIAAIYPETGVHFWWTPKIRLSAFGRYFVTSAGRHADDWLFGGGIAVFSK